MVCARFVRVQQLLTNELPKQFAKHLVRCPEWDLNPHGGCPPEGFKPSASADSAIRAMQTNYLARRLNNDVFAMRSKPSAPVCRHMSMNALQQRLFVSVLALALLTACTSNSDEPVAVPTSGSVPGSEATESAGSTESTIAPTPITEPSLTTDPDLSIADQAEASEVELATMKLAEEIGVDKLAVWELRPGERPENVIAVSGGSASTLKINDGWAWADNKFIYGAIHSDGGPPSSTVLTYDGTVVCELFGDVHHATARTDGTIVVAVDTTDYSQEPSIPTAAAHDCATGTRQPIESWVDRRGNQDFAQYTVIERVAGRVFRLAVDAEGNAEATNESGISINGDDYAGDHVFSSDGSVVVYADFSNLIHVSRSLRARDSSTGDLLWSVELERPYISLTIVDNLVLVGIPAEKDNGYYLDETTPESVLVLELASGQALDSIETDLQIIGAG